MSEIGGHRDRSNASRYRGQRSVTTAGTTVAGNISGVNNLVPKAGLEPARLAAPPPQDGVSANSTTSAFELCPIFPTISFPASPAVERAGCSAAAEQGFVALAEPAAAVVVAGSSALRLRE